MQDKMIMGDGAKIHLQCSHEFSGGELRCKRCNRLFESTAAIDTTGEVEFTDGSEFLTHEI